VEPDPDRCGVDGVLVAALALVAYRLARSGAGPDLAAPQDPDLIDQRDDLRAVGVLAGIVRQMAAAPFKVSISSRSLRFSCRISATSRGSAFVT